MFRRRLGTVSYKSILKEVNRSLERRKRRALMRNRLLAFFPTICAICWTAYLIAFSLPGLDYVCLPLTPVIAASAVLSTFAVHRNLSLTSKMAINLLLSYGSLFQQVSLSRSEEADAGGAFKLLARSRALENAALTAAAACVFLNPLTVYSCAFIFPLILNHRLKTNGRLEERCFSIVKRHAAESPSAANFVRVRRPIPNFSSRKIAATTAISLGVLSGYWNLRIAKVLEGWT